MASHLLWVALTTALIGLASLFLSGGQSFPALMSLIIVLIGAAFGLIGYGMVERRKIAWVALLFTYWLLPAFVSYWTGLLSGLLGFIFMSALLIPVTVYLHRRWQEFG